MKSSFDYWNAIRFANMPEIMMITVMDAMKLASMWLIASGNKPKRYLWPACVNEVKLKLSDVQG